MRVWTHTRACMYIIFAYVCVFLGKFIIRNTALTIWLLASWFLSLLAVCYKTMLILWESNVFTLCSFDLGLTLVSISAFKTEHIFYVYFTAFERSSPFVRKFLLTIYTTNIPWIFWILLLSNFGSHVEANISFLICNFIYIFSKIKFIYSVSVFNFINILK